MSNPGKMVAVEKMGIHHATVMMSAMAALFHLHRNDVTTIHRHHPNAVLCQNEDVLIHVEGAEEAVRRCLVPGPALAKTSSV